LAIETHLPRGAETKKVAAPPENRGERCRARQHEVEIGEAEGVRSRRMAGVDEEGIREREAEEDHRRA
jgi:hypothetical protein